MDCAEEAPSINHFRIGRHVDPIVDRGIRGHDGKREIVGEPVLRNPAAVRLEGHLSGEASRLNQRGGETGNEGGMDGDGKAVVDVPFELFLKDGWDAEGGLVVTPGKGGGEFL